MSQYQKAIFSKTLLCYLQALEGKAITVELRNESSVTGNLIEVDSHMNLQIANATFTHWGYAKKQHFNDLFIKGKQIRFVRTDDQLDVLKTLQKQIKNYKRVRTYDERIKVKKTEKAAHSRSDKIQA